MPASARQPARLIRRLASAYAFLSHSKRDWEFVKTLLNELKNENVWVDQFDLDLGDPLPDRIERGIQKASSFILVLSRNSLESAWVQFESHMAVIRHLEDQNFRLVILRIDDCEVPLRFKPFLYADSTDDLKGIKAVAKFVATLSDRATGSTRLRRHFVNRSSEIGAIEAYTNDTSVSIICIDGFFGIGKRSLAEEALRRIWQEGKLTTIKLTAAHVGSRLCADLCAAAGIGVPPDGSELAVIQAAQTLAAESIVSRGDRLLFDHVDSLLDDQGILHEDLKGVLEHLSATQDAFNSPIFLLTKRMPHLDLPLQLRTAHIRLKGLPTEHMVTILEGEIARLSNPLTVNREELKEIASHLHGYALAGRLTAPLFLKYPASYIASNLAHITGLKRDIADAILAEMKLSEDDLKILRVLSITVQVPLTVPDLIEITGEEQDDVVAIIDSLADHNLIDSEGAGVFLHPLLSDFYWKQARVLPDLARIAALIGGRAKNRLRVLEPNDVAYVAWLALGCRAFFLADKPSEAYALRRDFIGELKVVAIDLYQRQEYEQALKYCEEYLASYPDDFEVAFHQARSLSRLSRSNEALGVLDRLFALPQTPFRKARLFFGRARTFLEAKQNEAAKEDFLNSLAHKPDYLPALQGITDVLMRDGAYDEAWPFIEKALLVSPLDSAALSAKADVLWRRGSRPEAIQAMKQVVRIQPTNATFLFRLGRFYHQSEQSEEARSYFERAKAADPSYLDVRLSLASVLIDENKLVEARAELDSIGSKGSIEKQSIWHGVEAKYWLAFGDFSEAIRFAESGLKFRRTPTALGLAAKVEASLMRDAEGRGLHAMAQMHRVRAAELNKEGLAQDPTNVALQRQLDSL